MLLSEGSTKRKYKTEAGPGHPSVLELFTRNTYSLTDGPVTEDVKFKPVKGWLGGNKKERVEGWNAEVWEASGLMAKRLVTRAGVFRVKGTFSEYLAAAGEGQADVVELKSVGSMEDGQEDLEELEREAREAAAAAAEESEDGERNGGGGYSVLGIDDDGFGGPVPKPRPKVDRSLTTKADRGGGGSEKGHQLSHSQSSSAAASAAAASSSSKKRKPAKEAKPRKITARCWLAEGFPLKVDDLLPILDVMSHANKHLKKVNRFVKYWRGEHGRFFPVKVQVPIVMTVYAVMHFRDFALLPRAADGLGGLPPDHFDVPAGYSFKTLGEALQEAEEEERRLLTEEMEERERESAALKNNAGGAKGSGEGGGEGSASGIEAASGGIGKGGRRAIGGALMGGKGHGGAPVDADADAMNGDGNSDGDDDNDDDDDDEATTDDDGSGGWMARELPGGGAGARLFGGGGGGGGRGGGGVEVDDDDGVAELAAALNAHAREAEEEGELM